MLASWPNVESVMGVDPAPNGTGELVDDNQGVGYSSRIETGREVRVGSNWSVTAQAQLAHASVDFDDFTNPFCGTKPKPGHSLRLS